MKIQVLYFAVFRQRLGRDEEIIDLPEGSDVAAAVAVLAARHAPIAALAGKYRVAVNQAMSDDDTVLADGDEIALIPPVAGGNDDSEVTSARRRVAIVEDPPSLDRCIARVICDEMGGLVTFTGVVRRHSRGQIVTRLEYEAYAVMAEKVMAELCDEIEDEIAGAVLACEHRVGTLGIGDIAVVIAAAAPHRDEAFRACRAMIDRLKERVPIWKKELTEDGDEWIGLGP